ncbi:hypothetical protein [Brevundimonas sp. NIBR11]|uniref:hypothetical protein n=1 Tax=Brevundimonas sp. NIBR11 TaxID=3015999 RepID=UPI0022F0C4AF|nr:hypothetical protein [Brevundimonas sp. NIBR11]WGM31287.1 hypothetical protein KKHFBJBL_01531 [Brevundimonas sp. NIBR11]
MSETVAGSWTGIYFYPEDHPDNPDDLWPPTAFVAELIDRAGVLTGWVREPDMLYDGPERTAEIEGERIGDSVVFTKTPTDGADQIEYAGALIDDGRRIEGRWHIVGDWSGRFRMDRAGLIRPEERISAERTMDAPVDQGG